MVTSSPSFRKVLLSPPPRSMLFDPLHDSSSMEPKLSGSCWVMVHTVCTLYTTNVIHIELIYPWCHQIRSMWETKCFTQEKRENVLKETETTIFFKKERKTLSAFSHKSPNQALSMMLVKTLTGPLIVPEASRSPGLTLQPLTVWWVSCCFMVQYMYWRRREMVKSAGGLFLYWKSQVAERGPVTYYNN